MPDIELFLLKTLISYTFTQLTNVNEFKITDRLYGTFSALLVEFCATKSLILSLSCTCFEQNGKEKNKWCTDEG